MVLYAALAVVWTWPLALHFSDHIPGLPGDNFSFLWNLWWMRKALGSAELEFFRSTYLFSPFGVDLVNHPHTALQGYLSATVLAKWSVIEAENLYIFVSVLLNALGAVREARDLARLPLNDLASSRVSGQLLEAGAFRADVSGAGPCVYGLFVEQSQAEAAARALRTEGPTWVVTPVHGSDMTEPVVSTVGV